MSKKATVGKLILFTLEKAIDGYCRIEDFAYHHYRYHYGIPELKKAAIAQELKRLREKGYIEKFPDKKNESKIIFMLTEAGKEFLLLSKSESEIEWDGRWRFVVFDIPESKRVIRSILRNRLKLWGFVPWQKSVWVSKKNLTNKLRSLVKELGIEDWVMVIESDNVGR